MKCTIYTQDDNLETDSLGPVPLIQASGITQYYIKCRRGDIYDDDTVITWVNIDQIQDIDEVVNND